MALTLFIWAAMVFLPCSCRHKTGSSVSDLLLLLLLLVINGLQASCWCSKITKLLAANPTADATLTLCLYLREEALWASCRGKRNRVVLL